MKSRALLELDGNGVARHISHVQKVPRALNTEASNDNTDSDDSSEEEEVNDLGEAAADERVSEESLRRSQRVWQPKRICDCADCQ